MKGKSWHTLIFFLLFLHLEIFCTSCTPKLSKPSLFPTSNAEKIKSHDIENPLQKAFKLYNQGQLSEAAQKLETAIQITPQVPLTSSLVSLYTMLAFFQEKGGDTEKAIFTSSVLRDLFQKLKNIPPESEALAFKLIQLSLQLKVNDRLQFWERLRPIASASHGKAGEAGVLWQIGEAYIFLNNYHKAYECSIEALKLARDSGESALEVYVSMVISKSLMGLGRIQEAEVILQEVLIKTKENPLLKANILLQLGLVNAMLGRENQSIKLFQDAITIARSIGATDLEAKIEFVFVAAYFELKKPREALKKAITALSLFEKLNDTANMANVEGVIAEVYFQNSSFKEAKHHALRAVELYRQLGNRIGEAKSLRIAGQSLAELNKVDDALEILEKASDIQVEEKNLDEASKTYWWTIEFLKKLGRMDDVRHSLLTALDANARIFGEKKVEVQIRNELAKVYRELGLFSEALNQFGKVFILYKELSNIKGQTHALLEMATIYANLKDYENWIMALTIAEHLGANLNDPNIQLMVLNQNAEVYRKIGKMVDALQKYMEGLRISQLISKPAESGQLTLLGWFYLDMNEYARALDCFEKGFKLARDTGESIWMSHHLLGMGHTFLLMQKYDDAIKASREVLEITRALKSKSDEDSALALMRLALTGQKDYEAALQVGQEKLQLALESGRYSHIQEAYSGLGYIYIQTGKYSEAVEAYKKAITWTENLRSEIIGAKHKIRFLEKQLSPYDGIIEGLYQLYIAGDSEKKRLAEEALHFAELSKARSWVDQLSLARLRFIEESVPQEVRKKEEDAFKQFLTAREAHTSASSRYRIPEEELQKEERAWEFAQKKWEDFIEELYRRYPKYVTLRYPLARRRYPEDSFRKLAIREGETLIIYKLSPNWTHAWTLKKKEGRNEILKFTRLPLKTNDIEKLVEKFLTPFRIGKNERFTPKVDAELYNAIVQPAIEGVKPSKHLVIVPDGILSVVPFEALITEVRGGDKGQQTQRFLCDKFYISYYPSAAILSINRQTVPQNLPLKGTILAFGDPVYAQDDERLAPSQVSFLHESEQRQEPNIVTLRGKVRKGAKEQGYAFERLKHSGVELQKIKDAFGSRLDSLELLIGVEASEKQVKSKDLTKYQYLHFAVHGILAYDVPYLNEPALVLTADPDGKEDGFLTLSEIYRLNLNADLVTLSACKTGLGQRIAGEGVIGLSRAFIYAGARAVIVSLWEVADHSTALFMEEFYRLLAQGIDKVEALSKAKEYLRKRAYENPYFWAAFILIGD